ncbi:MAG: hypothetical protein M3480_03945 [Verrucomicrobiota bacterium]|jgi:hypothetical protein|nr:hypothetical protein [Verrucomicrobiota bacterium]
MKKFEVKVEGEIEPYRAETRTIVFHGVNKSGSMCLSNVFRTAYILAERRDEFYCHYHRPRVEFDELLRNIDRSVGPALFISHNLYGAVTLNPQRVMTSMFRHPLPRVVSGYQWLKTRFVENGGKPEEFQSLEEFVEKGQGLTWSQIAQFGIGYDPEVRGKKWTRTPEETYQLCRENIERDLHWFGIAELFEETIFIFAAICGLSRVTAWEKDVRNPGRALASELSPAAQEMIRHYYRYDFELYNHVLSLFRERLSRLQVGGEFAAYKSACAAEYKERLLDDQPVAKENAH